MAFEIGFDDIIMISTVILYKNEEKSLLSCLDSLDWCSDIVIVCDHNDNCPVPAISREGVTIVKRLLESDFSAQRAYGMEQAKNEWVLFVDADERISPELKNKLITITLDNSLSAYAISRVDMFWNQKLLCGEVGSALKKGIIRLVHKHRGQWKGTVHEVFVPQGNVGKLHGLILHFPHQTIAEFLHDVNYYSSIRAKEIQHRPTWQLFTELLVYPPTKFFYTYFIKLGFLDGAAGFVYSFMMSFHSFLVRAKALTKTW